MQLLSQFTHCLQFVCCFLQLLSTHTFYMSKAFKNSSIPPITHIFAHTNFVPILWKHRFFIPDYFAPTLQTHSFFNIELVFFSNIKVQIGKHEQYNIHLEHKQPAKTNVPYMKSQRNFRIFFLELHIILRVSIVSINLKNPHL